MSEAKQPEAGVDTTREERVLKALEEAKKFDDVVIIGLTGSRVDVAASTPSFAHINHVLNKATLEILLFEKAIQAQQQAQEG